MPPVRTPVSNSEHFPFDVDFQKALLRLVAEDETFGIAAMEHLQPRFFESDVLGWVFGYMQRFQAQYGGVPSLRAVQQETRNLDPTIRPIYQAEVERIAQASLRDEAWLREATLDFAKRNIFVKAFQAGRDLYNQGKAVEAYDLMMGEMDSITRVRWEPIDGSSHFANLALRQSDRILKDPSKGAIPTGFPSLDAILRGGLHPGELGIWMAYAKVGKSTMLMTLGLEAARRHFRVLHIVLEGSRKLIHDRYDAAFVQESYTDVKAGRMTPESYRLALQDYQYLRHNLWVEGFVDQWDVSVLTIESTIRRLEKGSGWKPQLIVIDYADLMTGRDKKYYKSETESQRAAYRDVKRLTNRGYAIWTASQAQRPKEKDLDRGHILYSNAIADSYEKVRAGDFLGSLNQAPVEQGENVMRAYAEMYRDNAANKIIYLEAKFGIMSLKENVEATLGYAAKGKAPPAPPICGGQTTAFA